MKTKLFCLVLALILGLSLVACGTTESPAAETVRETAPEETAPVSEPVMETTAEGGNEAFVCRLSDGREITLGGEADAVLASLGEYRDMLEAPSCIHDGYDRVYTYDGFSVTTSPDGNGKDTVTEFAVETSACVLDGGVTVGSTVDEMVASFGDDYTDSFGFIRYERGNTVLSFVTEDGAITSIVFSVNAQ